MDRTPINFSVIVPTFNGRTRGYLDAALESVLKQTLPPKEIILVDDGSADGTDEHVRAKFPSVQVIRQGNQGVSAARNAGVMKATGTHIAFLDDDDIWLPGKLQDTMEFLSRRPDCRFVYSGQTFIDEASRQGRTILPSGLGLKWPAILMSNHVFGPSTVVVERALAIDCGGFDPDFRLSEDYDFYIRCAKASPLGTIAAAPVLYRMHSQKSSTNLAEVDRGTFAVIDKHLACFDPKHQARLRRYLAYGAMIRALIRRDTTFAAELWRQNPAWRHPFEWLVRFCGIVAAPFPGLKASVRAYEARQLFSN